MAENCSVFKTGSKDFDRFVNENSGIVVTHIEPVGNGKVAVYYKLKNVNENGSDNRELLNG